MPNAKGAFTEREAAFIKHVVQSGSVPYAAEKAGYAQPRSSGYLALRRPAIDAAVRAETMALLHNELRPLALRHLRAVLDDPKAPIRDKTMVAKIVLDKTDGLRDAGDAKEPHEMTADELERARQVLMAELAQRAAPVTLEHEAEPGGSVFD